MQTFFSNNDFFFIWTTIFFIWTKELWKNYRSNRTRINSFYQNFSITIKFYFWFLDGLDGAATHLLEGRSNSINTKVHGIFHNKRISLEHCTSMERHKQRFEWKVETAFGLYPRAGKQKREPRWSSPESGNHRRRFETNYDLHQRLQSWWWIVRVSQILWIVLSWRRKRFWHGYRGISARSFIHWVAANKTERKFEKWSKTSATASLAKYNFKNVLVCILNAMCVPKRVTHWN